MLICNNSSGLFVLKWSSDIHCKSLLQISWSLSTSEFQVLRVCFMVLQCLCSRSGTRELDGLYFCLDQSTELSWWPVGMWYRPNYSCCWLFTISNITFLGYYFCNQFVEEPSLSILMDQYLESSKDLYIFKCRTHPSLFVSFQKM